jgi:hypothetical protein
LCILWQQKHTQRKQRSSVSKAQEPIRSEELKLYNSIKSVSVTEKVYCVMEALENPYSLRQHMTMNIFFFTKTVALWRLWDLLCRLKKNLLEYVNLKNKKEIYWKLLKSLLQNQQQRGTGEASKRWHNTWKGIEFLKSAIVDP